MLLVLAMRMALLAPSFSARNKTPWRMLSFFHNDGPVGNCQKIPGQGEKARFSHLQLWRLGSGRYQCGWF